jgi:tetratricopeptide (TPR) repeat protein
MKALLYAILVATILNADFKSDDLHASFWANYTGFNRKPSEAFFWYKKHLCRANLPGYMYRGLLHLFDQTANFSQIVSLMPLIEQAFANDVEMQMLFVQALKHTGNHNDADVRIMNLISRVPNNQDLTFQAAQTYLQRKEPENALKTIDDYLVHASGKLNNFVFYFLKAQIYLMLDKKVEALAELQRSLDIHPTFDKGWLLYGLLQEQLGSFKKAIKGYMYFLNLSQIPAPHIQDHILRLEKKYLSQQKRNNTTAWKNNRPSAT